jgi:hypothetical protein
VVVRSRVNASSDKVKNKQEKKKVELVEVFLRKDANA